MECIAFSSMILVTTLPCLLLPVGSRNCSDDQKNRRKRNEEEEQEE